MIEGVVAALLAEGTLKTASKAGEIAEDIHRNQLISEELGPVATEFNESFRERVEESAEEIESYALQSIASHWGIIAEEIEAYESVFKTERDAVDWLVESIVEVEDVDLTEKDEEELREIVAEEYADAVDSFRERIEGNEKLQRRFQEDIGMELLQRLNKISESFERLAGGHPYELYSYPEDIEDIQEVLIPGESVEFVDRDEVPSNPEPGRHLILGPSGSGKTRVIAERIKRFPDDSIKHVLMPEKRLLDPSDARSLARQSFDGDVLLVWQNLHKVEEGQENAVIERVLRELKSGLEEQDQELYTLLEARSDRLHSLPGNIPSGFDDPKSFWIDYEPLRVGSMSAAALCKIVERAASEVYDIELSEEAGDTLVESIVDSESAPVYIDTVLKTAEDCLTVEDIKGLSEEVSDIWQRHYDSLRDESPEEMKVLKAMKALYDFNVPRYSKLVRAIYLELFNGKRGSFRTSVESLVNRQWLTVSGNDIVDLEAEYSVHDTQLDAVSYEEAKDDAKEISELLLEEVDRGVPEESSASFHFYAGVSLDDWDMHEESEKHYRRAMYIDPELAEAYVNYGTLLYEELNNPKRAKEMYEKAIEIDPELAEAYYNYGGLFSKWLNNYSEAKKSYKKAIELDSEFVEAYYNYGILLQEKLEEPDKAKEKYEKAIELDPEHDAAYVNYGTLLYKDFDDARAAEKKYKKAIEIDAEYAGAYYNYGKLLAQGLDNPSEAKKKYESAIELDPEDPSARSNYGRLLFEKFDEKEKAIQELEQSVSLWRDEGDLPEAIHDQMALVAFYISLGDEEAVIKNCELALEILDEASNLDPNGRVRLGFESMGAVAEGEETVEIYRYALKNVEASNQFPAAQIFKCAWRRRHEHDEDSQAYNAAVSSGVALAAHLFLMHAELEVYFSHTVEEILEEIDGNNLLGAQKAVYDYLHPEKEVETTLREIGALAEKYERLGMEVAFETLMFGKILHTLENRTAQM